MVFQLLRTRFSWLLPTLLAAALLCACADEDKVPVVVEPEIPIDVPTEVLGPAFSLDGVHYYIEGDSAFVGKSHEATGDITILPEITVKDKVYPVKRIEDYAFFECKTLTSVSISKGIEHIGIYAFDVCESLRSVSIPEGMRSIGERAFDGCISLTTVSIPGSVEDIGNFAFYGCESLSFISIAEGVKHIGSYAFSGCESLFFVSLPSSITKIGTAAFHGLPLALMRGTTPPEVEGNDKELAQAVIVPVGSEATYEAAGWLVANDFTALSGSECHWMIISLAGSHPSEMLYVGGKGEVVACDQWEDYAFATAFIDEGITHIANSTFEGKTSLKRLFLPPSLTSIGECAFKGCTALTGVNIPAKVERIENHAFVGCTALTDFFILRVDDTEIFIGEKVLENSAAEKITLSYIGKKLDGTVFSGFTATNMDGDPIELNQMDETTYTCLSHSEIKVKAEFLRTGWKVSES